MTDVHINNKYGKIRAIFIADGGGIIRSAFGAYKEVPY
jgi:hypothetical protein